MSETRQRRPRQKSTASGYETRPARKAQGAARQARRAADRYERDYDYDYDYEYEREARPAQRSKAKSASSARSVSARASGAKAASGQAGKRKKRKKKKTSAGNVLLNWLIALTLALFLGFICKTFVFELIAVKGDAMYNTLSEGEVVLMTKFDYWSAMPRRGDVVAISTQDGIILRRVVGLPGETIAIESGDTLINGQIMQEPYVGLRTYDNYAEVTIPNGRFFVLSDNRTVNFDSRDSRVDLVNKNRIIGRVRTVAWPLDRLMGGM